MLKANTFVYVVLCSIFFACASTKEDINLDHYGAFENQEVEITIRSNDMDSCTLEIRNYQELYGWLNFDTTLSMVGGQTSTTNFLTLERPSIIQLVVNGKERELFLVPSINDDFTIEIDREEIILTFSNPDLQKINLYYWEKASVGGDMRLRKLITSAVTLPTLAEVSDSLASVRMILREILNHMDIHEKLPTWFVSYEEKCIDYQCLTLEASAYRVRKNVFGITDPPLESSDIHRMGFDINDELAMISPYFISALPRFVRQGLDLADMDSLPTDVVMDHYFEKSVYVSNDRIRNVYLAFLYHSMVRTSAFIPDTLLAKVRRSISADFGSYLERIDRKYLQLDGLPAPVFHLVSTADTLVSLHDFKGNLLLLDFWSVGCRFCKLENPYIKDLLHEFRGERFKVLQIYMHSDRGSWEKIKGDFNGIPLFCNEQWAKKLKKSYQISGYPRYVLINEQGIVLEGWCERPSNPALRQRIADHFASMQKSI